MHKLYFASLFGPGQTSFEEAQDWARRLALGEIKSFVPVHGKVAGYHVEHSNSQIPVQMFDPPLREGQEVTVLFVNKFGNVSLMRGEEGVLRFYPHVNANVEYDG